MRPSGKKISISRGGISNVSGQHIGLCDAAQSMAAVGTLAQSFLERGTRLIPLHGFQVGVAKALLLRAKIARRLRVAQLPFFLGGLLEQVDRLGHVSASRF